jgi:predicted RecA/RadA family phage recombinase
MATNYLEEGEAVELAAPYDRLSGEGALVGSLFGVAVTTVVSGSRAAFVTTGVWFLKKLSTEVWTLGAKIYWDNAARQCTTVSAGNTLIGAAVDVTVNPSALGKVRLNGTVA